MSNVIRQYQLEVLPLNAERVLSLPLTAKSLCVRKAADGIFSLFVQENPDANRFDRTFVVVPTNHTLPDPQARWEYVDSYAAFGTHPDEIVVCHVYEKKGL